MTIKGQGSKKKVCQLNTFGKKKCSASNSYNMFNSKGRMSFATNNNDFVSKRNV